MHMWFISALVSLFNLQAELFVFEGAHIDFQAESIRMRDNCLLRLGSKQLLQARNQDFIWGGGGC